MCTILFSWKSTPKYNLILLANRDEFYERETKTAHWWEDYPYILGGRDLKAGGTWMGITKSGRIAAITNYRKFPLEQYETSRGDLVRNFLTGNEKPENYLEFLTRNGNKFEGFNLIFGDTERLFYFSNKGSSMSLKSDIYGISNHLLDTNWPKIERGKSLFRERLNSGTIKKEGLFELLSDKQKAPDHRLPDTGIGLDKERLLSPIFIESPNYGTRLSTVLTIDHEGNVDFHERSFVPEDEKRFQFKIR